MEHPLFGLNWVALFERLTLSVEQVSARLIAQYRWVDSGSYVAGGKIKEVFCQFDDSGIFLLGGDLLGMETVLRSQNV